MISPEEVKKLFELARIEASAEELQKFPKELDAILGYIKILTETPLGDVAPTISFTGKNVPLRADESIAPVKELKNQFPETENGYLKTKKVSEES